MFATTCLIGIHTSCSVVDLVLFGRLAGLFAVKSFGDHCDFQHTSSIAPMKNNNTYSERIELNAFNDASWHT